MGNAPYASLSSSPTSGSALRSIPSTAAQNGRIVVRSGCRARSSSRDDGCALQLDAGLGGDGGDVAGQSDVAPGDPVRVVAGQPDVDVAVTQVEIGMVVHRLRRRPDGIDECEAGGEVRRTDAGLQSAEQVGPTDQGCVGDLLSGELGHEAMLANPTGGRKGAFTRFGALQRQWRYDEFTGNAGPPFDRSPPTRWGLAECS